MGQTNVSADKAPIDPLRICIQAERFLFADEKPRSREVLTGPEVGAYVMLPCLVMEAFSVELYIKCLICLEDHPVPRFHHLKKPVRPAQRQNSKRTCRAVVADSDSRDAFREMLPAKWHGAVSDDVRQALSDGSRAFEELRYAYEGGPTCRFYIDTLPRMLRHMIWQRKPEWRGLGPGHSQPLTSLPA